MAIKRKTINLITGHSFPNVATVTIFSHYSHAEGYFQLIRPNSGSTEKAGV